MMWVCLSIIICRSGLALRFVDRIEKSINMHLHVYRFSHIFQGETSMNNQKRQRKIRELIMTNEIGTQAELRKRLSDAGYHVAKSTLSKDLKEMEIGKKRFPNGDNVYGFFEKFNKYTNHPIKKMQELFSDTILSVHVSGNFVIVKSEPGNAKAIGYFIECLHWKEIAGIISGDDNCLLLCRTKMEANNIEYRFNSINFLTTTNLKEF
ncbi:hypothetical protein CAI16_18535 [Virgibacillus dokdonensis]|uniref:Arginine repressor n=2 Tax=Virgibacillus dokdonensis TaxID=302167 RepID=A0A3E0WJC9_9BACI|nr:hypothetical protein CAI16_18535 [Virgibacillus dokdonensis]